MKDITKPYIIGETAYHHEGEVDFLIELINHAKQIGLDAIKFHALFDIHDYFVHDHEGLPVIQKISLSKEQMNRAILHAQAKGLDVVLLCNDVAAIKWAIADHNLAAIEIHATGLNDVFLLEEAAFFDKTIILGVGGSTIDEIKFAIDYLKSKGKDDILLMHGFQNYPTAYSDIFLERIEKFQQLFGLPMGYADHTDPMNENNEWISVLGLTKKAYVVEKHFTSKFGEKRIDAQAAISLQQMKKVRELADIVFKVLGTDSPLDYSLAEKKYGDTGPMKKAPVAKVPIVRGEPITFDNIAFKRTNVSASIKQKDILNLIGLKANQDIAKDGIIDYSKVDFEFIVADASQFNNTNK